MKRISISDRHGNWLGTGILNQRGHITDCPVLLGDDPGASERLVKQLEGLISSGQVRGQVGSYAYEVYDSFG